MRFLPTDVDTGYWCAVGDRLFGGHTQHIRYKLKPLCNSTFNSKGLAYILTAIAVDEKHEICNTCLAIYNVNIKDSSGKVDLPKLRLGI